MMYSNNTTPTMSNLPLDETTRPSGRRQARGRNRSQRRVFRKTITQQRIAESKAKRRQHLEAAEQMAQQALDHLSQAHLCNMQERTLRQLAEVVTQTERQLDNAHKSRYMSYAGVMEEGDWIQLRITSTQNSKRDHKRRHKKIQKARAQCRKSKHTSF